MCVRPRHFGGGDGGDRPRGFHGGRGAALRPFLSRVFAPPTDALQGIGPKALMYVCIQGRRAPSMRGTSCRRQASGAPARIRVGSPNRRRWGAHPNPRFPLLFRKRLCLTVGPKLGHPPAPLLPFKGCLPRLCSTAWPERFPATPPAGLHTVPLLAAPPRPLPEGVTCQR